MIFTYYVKHVKFISYLQCVKPAKDDIYALCEKRKTLFSCSDKKWRNIIVNKTKEAENGENFAFRFISGISNSATNNSNRVSLIRTKFEIAVLEVDFFLGLVCRPFVPAALYERIM